MDDSILLDTTSTEPEVVVYQVDVIEGHEEAYEKQLFPREHGQATTELEIARAETAELEREVEALRSELKNAKNLLQTRNDELLGVQSFLSTADKTSFTDVRRAVERLNAEVFQLAATLADSFTFSSARETQGKIQAGHRLKEVLGPRMLGLLKAVKHDEDPYCVQLALQACLASHAARLSTQWSASDQKEINFMQSVYEKIRESGESYISVSRLSQSYLEYPKSLRQSAGDGGPWPTSLASSVSHLPNTRQSSRASSQHLPMCCTSQASV